VEKFSPDFYHYVVKGRVQIVEQTTYNDQTIIRYLLNELSEEDQTHFEDAYLVDGSLFDQLRAVEDELIEDYVRGNLSDRERRLFERHYLASEQRRARVEAARQLVHVCSLQSAVQADTEARTDSIYLSLRSWLQSLAGQRMALVFGVAAALLLLFGSGLFIELLRLRARLAVVNDERAALQRRVDDVEQQLADEREQLAVERQQNIDLRERLGNVNSRSDLLVREPAPPQSPKNQIVLLALEPGIRDIKKLDSAVIYADTSLVELRVTLDRQERQRSYRAAVKTVDGGKEIWIGEGIKPRQHRSAQYVVVRVPADRFRAARAQDFTLTLSAPVAGGKYYEELEIIYFQVIAR
jgi:hypothetical protein